MVKIKSPFPCPSRACRPALCPGLRTVGGRNRKKPVESSHWLSLATMARKYRESKEAQLALALARRGSLYQTGLAPTRCATVRYFDGPRIAESAAWSQRCAGASWIRLSGCWRVTPPGPRAGSSNHAAPPHGLETHLPGRRPPRRRHDGRAARRYPRCASRGERGWIFNTTSKNSRMCHSWPREV